MKYRCPYCEGIGSIQGFGSNNVVEDSEMYIAKCKSCKEDFSVAFTISQAPDIDSDFEGLSEKEMLSKLFGGEIYGSSK
jgi:excinuclease UvrABC ATPase subunit